MKKIIIIFIIIVLIFLGVCLYKKNYTYKKHDDFSVTKQVILDNIQDKQNIVIYINGQQIDKNDFEIQKKVLDTYTEEEKIELNKNNEVIEAIKHIVVLKEAEKENIKPTFDEKAMEVIANSLYESSDKTLPKEEYVEKYIEVQKENEIKSIYMAEIMEKIVNNEIKTDDDEVIRLMKDYNNDKNVNNLRKIYEAYIESIIEEYELEISKNGENIYKNFK